MKTVFYILHMLGLVGLIVTLVISLQKPIKKLSVGTLHSAWLQLLSGLALLGIMSGQRASPSGGLTKTSWALRLMAFLWAI